jgi:hypothetical protein
MPDAATLQMIARLIDETSGPLKNISKAFADFKHGADPEKTTSQFKGLSGAIGSVGSQINQVAAPALASLGIRAGISAASIIGLTKVAADYARTMSDLKGSAQIMNMTTAATIQWDRATRAVGISGGTKALEGVSMELLKIKDNVAGVAEEYRQMDPSGSLYAKLFPHAQRGDTEGAVKEIIKWIDELQKKGEFGRAEITAQRFLPGGTAKQWLEAQQLKQEMPPPGPDAVEQAEKLNRTMQKFWTTWDEFYQSAMTNLIPGVDKMMQGMTAGFKQLPQVIEDFMRSPAGKVLAAMVPKEQKPDEHPEGQQLPPPKLEPPSMKRDFAGGWLPGLGRIWAAGSPFKLPEIITGKPPVPVMQPKSEEIKVPVNEWLERNFQTPEDYKGDAAFGGAPEKPPTDLRALLRAQQIAAGRRQGPQPILLPPAEPTSRQLKLSDIVPPQPTIAPTIQPPAPPTAAPAVLPPTPPTAPPVAAPTQPPATGADVKQGAKEGIIDGLLELYLRAPKATDEAVKKMSLTDPTAEVNQKPIQRAVETFASAESKPELQQDSKAGDLGRRLQQSAIDLQQVSLRESPSDAMRQLQGRAFVDQRREDQALRDRLLQPPQLLPGVDQITAALANQKVEGSATLKVDIAAPPGTRTDLRVAGLFNETEINRRRAFQMEKTATNDGFELG